MSTNVFHSRKTINAQSRAKNYGALADCREVSEVYRRHVLVTYGIDIALYQREWRHARFMRELQSMENQEPYGRSRCRAGMSIFFKGFEF